MANAKQIAHTLLRIGEDSRVFGLTMSERDHAITASILLPELLEVLQALLALNNSTNRERARSVIVKATEGAS